MSSTRIKITLEHNATSWVHRVGEATGELVYQSDECEVYYYKSCRCNKAKVSDIAYQACIAVQALGLHAGKLRGVK